MGDLVLAIGAKPIGKEFVRATCWQVRHAMVRLGTLGQSERLPDAGPNSKINLPDEPQRAAEAARKHGLFGHCLVFIGSHDGQVTLPRVPSAKHTASP